MSVSHYQSTLDAVYVYVVPWSEFPIVPSFPTTHRNAHQRSRKRGGGHVLWFRGGLVFEAHRLLYPSDHRGGHLVGILAHVVHCLHGLDLVSVLGFRVWGLGFMFEGFE